MVSRFSSVVPEWERRSLGNVRRWLREHAVPCIRRGNRRPAVLWEWEPLAWLRRHLQVLVLQVVRARLSVPGSAMFHVG